MRQNLPERLRAYADANADAAMELLTAFNGHEEPETIAPLLEAYRDSLMATLSFVGGALAATEKACR